VLLADAGVVVGEEPTAATDAGADVATAIGVSWWNRGGTLSDTSEEHFRTELPQPSSS
jgi:hypothetical protein